MLPMNRRQFLAATAATAFSQTAPQQEIIDIHQHTDYAGRPDDVLATLGLEPLDARIHRVGLHFAD